MRRTIATAAALLVAAGALSVPSAYADDAAAPDPMSETQPETQLETQPAPEPAIPVEPVDPTEALDTANRVMSGEAESADPSATVVLRDLWMARGQLRGRQRRVTNSLLARPTDGVADPLGMGYTVPSTSTCNDRLCVHYVTSGKDAPPSIDWVNQSLAMMDEVWKFEVDQLGYRKPLPDGLRGGSPRFDVYLKDIGSAGLYGYCAPESRGPGRTASSYCVLDNDFSAKEFPSSTPEGNRAVTAAHEFFHAVQYAYDYNEDPWMMESTATWMEERFATDVNDNRQYLRASQLYAPHKPLDVFNDRGYQYGNWIFWEYLSSRYGISIVKRAWNQAGSLRRDGRKYSLQALEKVLRGKGGFTKNYASFAGGNLIPDRTYPEGAAYRYPKVKGTKVLTRKRRAKGFGARVHHLSSRSFRFVPGRGLGGKKWKLALAVSGPAKRTSPAAHVIVQRKNGRVSRKLVRLNKRGKGHTKVAFSKRKVASVSVTLVNASTRFKCDQRTMLACAGRPLDNKLRFAVKATAIQRR